MLTLIATIVLLGVLIFVHELGHFLTAKAVDIRVPRFSIGFGPKIFGFRRGETEYVVSWIPLGGYVKMAGMDEMEAIEGKESPDGASRTTTVAVPVTDAGIADVEEYEDVERHFESKSLPARFLVISAGVLMNFLFAALIWMVVAGVWGVPRGGGPPVIGAIQADALPPGAASLVDVPANTRIVAVGDVGVDTREDLLEAIAMAPSGPIEIDFGEAGTRTIELPGDARARAEILGVMGPPWPPVIAQVVDGAPAAAAGFQAGDSVVSAAGEPIRDFSVLVRVIEAHAERPLPVTVSRDGRLVELEVVPAAEIDAETGETEGRIGVAAEPPTLPTERLGFFASIGYGFSEVGSTTVFIVESLWRLVSGQESVKNLGGPVLIGEFAGRTARAGLEHFLNFMALFSVNLAVLNLLPIPVLDGGHLLFLTVEAVRGRALSLKQRMRFSQVGFVILVAIMVLALANDLMRVLGRWLGG